MTYKQLICILLITIFAHLIPLNTARVVVPEHGREVVQTKPVEPLKQPKVKKVVKATKIAVKAPKQAQKKPGGKCEEWLGQAGITHQIARELINRESGCRSTAVNPSSGACGIAQELLESHQRAEQWKAVKAGYCPKSKCSMSDPVCQLKWMQSYVLNRYGSWAGAINHHNRNNWY